MIKDGALIMSSRENYKLQIITKYLSGHIYLDEAAKLLSVSLRTVSRYVKKIKDKGPIGIKHGNFGNLASKSWSEKQRRMVIELKKKEYFDFNTAHFVDLLNAKHGLNIPYITVWRWLSEMNMIKHRHKRCRKKHVYRPRMPQEGLLLQMDGSPHKFNGKDEWCLISCIDDATSEIPFAEFFDAETTLGCMKVLREVIRLKGVPKAIYTDKAGWSGGQKRTEFSQFQRACEKLGIQLIYANSPEAKGRIERSFRTIQDRLIPELRHHGITSMSDANTYLKDTFLKDYWNKEKIVPPALADTAYTPLDPYIDLSNVLCIEETRNIGSDQTISFGGNRYVLGMDGTNLSGFFAVIRTRLDGSVKVFVMENEVSATRIQDMPISYDPEKRRERFQSLNMEEDMELIKAMDEFALNDTPISLTRNWRAIDLAANAVRIHRVSGKPLRIKKKIKRVT
ncbi:MAG: ISNCY family transposase [Bdellovibrionales bacterium]|nr:ISNCY family transposase [Bdellovibrionales bacterium]